MHRSVTAVVEAATVALLGVMSWSELRDTWNRSNDVRSIAALLCFCGGIAVLSWRRR